MENDKIIWRNEAGDLMLGCMCGEDNYLKLSVWDDDKEVILSMSLSPPLTFWGKLKSLFTDGSYGEVLLTYKQSQKLADWISSTIREPMNNFEENTK